MCESLQASLRRFLASELLNTATDCLTFRVPEVLVGSQDLRPRVFTCRGLNLSERCYQRNFTRRQIRETRGANKRARGQINKRENIILSRHEAVGKAWDW